MKKPPAYWNKAKRILSKRDPVLRKIINKFNKGYLTSRKDPFFSLCRTIIGQQISTKAADSIWLKFEMKCKKKIVPKTVLKLTSRSLKSAGLSHQKITYLKNIAKSFNNKSFNIKDLQKIKKGGQGCVSFKNVEIIWGNPTRGEDYIKKNLKTIITGNEKHFR